MKRAALIVLLALGACGRNITGDTGPSPSASIAVKIVDLPKAVAGDDFVHAMFMVDVNADGTYAVNGVQVPEKDIMTKARDARTQSPDVRAVIRADKTVPFQRVITVMDLLKQGGVTKIAFGVSIPQPITP